MECAANIFLIGPMGSGKTTIGRQLARSLKKQFFDSDHEIEVRTGADIPWIFDIEGEAGFRARERAVIDQLSREHNIVLATGGGAVLDPENRQHLCERGLVIYLRASVAQQLQRTAQDQHRPLLQTADPRARLETLMQTRDPLYRDTADLIVDTDRCSIRHMVQRILKAISHYRDHGASTVPQGRA